MWDKVKQTINKNTVTTAAGAMIGWTLAQDISVDKLLAGDKLERNKAIASVAIAGWGWLTNRPSKQ